MACRGMIENHIEHQLDPVLARLPDQGFRILHRSEHRIDGQVIRYVIAVVIHGRQEKGCDPEIIDPQILQIIKL